MKISVIQPETLWEDKPGNLLRIEKMISLAGETDIVVLPEMFTTGFSVIPELLWEPPDGITLRWMTTLAEKGNFAICGSYIVKENNLFYNRWIFVTPDKKLKQYDKRHLFRMDNEDKTFTPGRKRITFTFRGVRILPNVCYDLRFPVWSRNRNDYDLLINSANWPLSRSKVWITLMKARAIENQCFVAGSNRVGSDGKGTKYCGNSMIINPKGEILASASDTEGVITSEISVDELNDFRTKFPVHKDADDFTLNPEP